MLPSAIYEPLPFAYMGSGLLLLGIADQPGLLLAGLAFYLAGSLAWFRRGAYRRPDKQQLRKQGWPLWLYESRPFAANLATLWKRGCEPVKRSVSCLLRSTCRT